MFYYKEEKIKDLIDFKEENFNKIFLLKDDEKMCILFALKKGQFIPTHISKSDAIIYIIDGEVNYILEHDEQKIIKLETGKILKFKKEEKHSVEALKDSKFMVIKI